MNEEASLACSRLFASFSDVPTHDDPPILRSRYSVFGRGFLGEPTGIGTHTARVMTDR